MRIVALRNRAFLFLLAVLAALFLPSCAERYKDIKVTGVRLESL